MAAEFTADEIIEVCAGRLAQGLMPDGAGRICSDTRALRQGEWYIALAGERFDGHDFLGAAFAAGAVGAIVSERGGYAIGNPQFPLIAVADTLEAFHALARNWRRRIAPKVVGITGSSGKTTTKEMCAAVLGAAFRCHKSRRNENNEYGVPKTILSMPDDTQALVLEMAMRGSGQIDQLARCARPDIGIITNAGSAHLELLGSLENIARAKSELLRHLSPDGTAIIGRRTPELEMVVPEYYSGTPTWYEDGCITVTGVTAEMTRFRVNGSSVEFAVHAHGEPLLQDAWCVIVAARRLGMADELIARGLRLYQPLHGRGNRLAGKRGSLIIDESYNANPDSVVASVSAILDNEACPKARRIVVLGELAELGPEGPQLHRQLGEWLKDKPLSMLITVGTLARYIAEGASGAGFDVLACIDNEEAAASLERQLDGDACVLIKGSRRAALDTLVSALRAQVDAAADLPERTD